MTGFEPHDPDFETSVRSNFARQKLMQTICARLNRVSPGEVEIELPFRDDLTQQHGYLHAGIVTAVVDSACGYAALSLTPPGSEVLSVEYKINFASPARGERIIARGRVIKAGRKITVCTGEVFAFKDGEEKLVAAMLATMMTIRDPA
jgi:uncharacterized protein (TIGR00369 family)